MTAGEKSIYGSSMHVGFCEFIYIYRSCVFNLYFMQYTWWAHNKARLRINDEHEVAADIDLVQLDKLQKSLLPVHYIYIYLFPITEAWCHSIFSQSYAICKQRYLFWLGHPHVAVGWMFVAIYWHLHLQRNKKKKKLLQYVTFLIFILFPLFKSSKMK